MASYILLQFLLFLLIALFTTSFLKKGRWIAQVVFSLLFVLQITAVYLSAQLIDYRFYMHLNFDDLRLVKSSFTAQLLLLVAIFAMVLMVLRLLQRLLHQRKMPSKLLRLLTITVCLAGMTFKGGAVRNLVDLFCLTTTNDQNFETALRKLSIDPSTYILPNEVQAQPGKNIVVIAMESFELAFLSDKLAHLTPNMRKLAAAHSLFRMPESPGSNWTSGSIYTFASGFPAFFKHPQNRVFQQTRDIQITGLGHVLKAAGYQLDYLLALKRYAGISDMLQAFGFDVHSEEDFDETYQASRWGMHDKDLFNEAKKQLKAYDRNRPFALFMSTISTHPDDGVYDERMEGIVQPQRSNLEFMAAATDHFIGELLAFLEKEGLRSNTVFYLFPDHLMMGMAPKVMQDFENPRSLFLLTDATPNDLSFSPDKTLYQIDLPQLILEGAGIKHNAQFLSNYIQQEDKKSFIELHKNELLAVNEAALKTANYAQGLSVHKSGKSGLRLEGENAITEVEAHAKNTFTFLFLFDENGSLLKAEEQSTYAAFSNQHPHLQLIVESRNDKLFCYLKKGKQLGIARQGTGLVEYSAEDVDLLDNWTFTAEEFTRPPQPNPFSPFDLIRLTSSIPGLIQLRHPPSVKIGDRSFPLQKGIHLLYKQRGQFLFETHVNEDQPHALAKKINQLMKDKRYFIVLANSFVNGFSAKDKALLTRLGFPILAKMNGKDAYIAYAYEGFARECWDAQTFSLLLPQQAEVRRSRKEIQQDAKDVKRFIAHAGGKIDGHTYTNSLEALNHSYKQGFRLFELDIMKTSDGTYVAVHNWEEWKSMTNYQGPFPVSRDTFLHYPLLGKYTPMDIHAINQWFSDHSDAILVTDKVNEADAFIAEFIDRKRLMMELFSLEEVMAAKKAGILGVMPSMHVINAMIGDKVAQLKALDIHYMTFSRYHLETNRDLLMEAKKNGIKTFVYNVNYAFGKDEAYVLCNELDLAFGMYADHWDFNH